MSFFEGWDRIDPTDADHLGKHYTAAGARAIVRGFAAALMALEAGNLRSDLKSATPPPWLVLVVADELWSGFPELADTLRRQLNREGSVGQ
jgi:hypothetical protein